MPNSTLCDAVGPDRPGQAFIRHGRCMDELYLMPGHLIRRAQQISTALFTEACGACDLTAVQFAALFAIRANPDVDATRLSALIAFDRSTIGDVLERMEAKGWISRGPSPLDRRIKLLRLSVAGEQLLQTVEPAIRRVQERLLAPLAPQDRVTMVRLLGELAELHNEVTTAPLRAATQRQATVAMRRPRHSDADH